MRWLSATVGALFLAVASASAVHAAPMPATGIIGGLAGADAGSTVGGRFVWPSDVALYTGNDADPHNDKLFVVEASDDGNSRVQRFGDDGTFELMWGRDVIRRRAPTDTGTGYEVCTHALSCKAARPGSSEGEFDYSSGVAVDQSNGHVYVAESGNRRVQEFDLDGGFVRAWGWGVRTGAPTFEICVSGCVAGRADGPEGNGNAGQLLGSGAIAISPVPPHDLFVTDSGNQRVSQFGSDGHFIRAWGVGVATGADRFEACTAASTCSESKFDSRTRFVSPSGWPRDVAVGDDGVVYVSDSDNANQIVRFDTEPPPLSPDATWALLEPLPSRTLLTSGTTEGVEVDPSTGNLFALRDPFDSEIAVVDEIVRPGARLSPSDPWSPAVAATHVIPAPGRIQGIALSDRGDEIYVPSAGIAQRESSPLLAGCPSTGLPPTCDGIIVLSAAAGPFAGFLRAPVAPTPPLSHWRGSSRVSRP